MHHFRFFIAIRSQRFRCYQRKSVPFAEGVVWNPMDGIRTLKNVFLHIFKTYSQRHSIIFRRWYYAETSARKNCFLLTRILSELVLILCYMYFTELCDEFAGVFSVAMKRLLLRCSLAWRYSEVQAAEIARLGFLLDTRSYRMCQPVESKDQGVARSTILRFQS